MGCGGIDENTCDYIQWICSFLWTIISLLLMVLTFALVPEPLNKIFGIILLISALGFVSWLYIVATRIESNRNDNSERSRQEAARFNIVVEPNQIEQRLGLPNQPQRVPRRKRKKTARRWRPRYFSRDSGSTNSRNDSDLGIHALRQIAAVVAISSGSQQDARCEGGIDPEVYNQGAGPSAVNPDREYRSDDSTMKGITSISTDDSKRTTPSEEVSELSLDGSEKQSTAETRVDTFSSSSKSKSKDVPPKRATPLEEIQVSAALSQLALGGSEKQAVEVPKQDSPSDGSEKQAVEVPKQDSPSDSSKSKTKDVAPKATTPLEKMQVSATLSKLALGGSEKLTAEVPKEDSTSPSSIGKSD